MSATLQPDEQSVSRSLQSALEGALAGRFLLDHPFYRRWQTGELEHSELAGYAEQYRHVEAELPSSLEAIAGALPAGGARTLVESNLADERGRPAPHLELFEGFARAAGAAPDATMTPATERLVETYRRRSASSACEGLGVVAAYEAQAAAIADSKGAGLRALYGYDAASTEFWDVHASLEREHAAWTLEALGEIVTERDDLAAVADAMVEGAQAWWDFLSEREAAHAAA